jgi:MYXO-CTERM domain-containing protein
VRIIPVVAADQTKPVWVVDPAPTLPTTSSSSGGGCTIGGDGHFDPIFPALLLAGLGFFGLRRFSRKS